jgi:DNA-binding PadR family transcriptional regulator
MTRPVPDEVILGLLDYQPAHGYDLLERFRSNKHLGRIWRMSTSQIYSVLKRLEDHGCVSGISVKAEDAPTRREYRLLPKGELHLNQWLYDERPSASLHRIRVIFLSRLYIALLLQKPVEKIFRNQIIVCKQKYNRFMLEQQEDGSKIEFMALDLVINQLSSVINWLEDYQERAQDFNIQEVI